MLKIASIVDVYPYKIVKSLPRENIYRLAYWCVRNKLGIVYFIKNQDSLLWKHNISWKVNTGVAVLKMRITIRTGTCYSSKYVDIMVAISYKRMNLTAE